LFQNSMELVGHLPLVAVVHLHGDGRFRRAQVGPETLIRFIAVDEDFQLMARREPDVRHQLDGFAKERIVDGRAAGWISGNSNSTNWSTAYDIEHADENEHGDEY